MNMFPPRTALFDRLTMTALTILIALLSIFPHVEGFSLKLAAGPLMDSGKALARSGELIIDLTTDLDLYGGGLSAAGAQIRNAGDSIAQAAASCRFKTGSELVTDELREAATCLDEACSKLEAAVQEAIEDEMKELAEAIEATIDPVKTSSTALEAAGACIMQRLPPDAVGAKLVEGGTSLRQLATILVRLDSGNANAALSGQRMEYAAEQMIVAGNEMRGVKPEKPKGKSWLKG